MFAFLGVYLRAVSAHKLISERRGVFLLHGLLSRGMWASSKANAACAPRGSVSAPLRAPLLGFLLLPSPLLPPKRMARKNTAASTREGGVGRMEQ